MNMAEETLSLMKIIHLSRVRKSYSPVEHICGQDIRWLRI